MGRLMISLSKLALLAVGLGATSALVTTAPAFNAEARVGNVFDQSILPLSSDMYDLPDYQMQQAVSFIRADLIGVGLEDGQAAAPVELAMDRARQAVALMEDSLARDPGSAPGWATMAWAQLYSGRTDAALTALRHAWALAPYSYALAQERIDLALVLFDPLAALDPAQAPELTEEDRTAILRDFETLRRHHRRATFEFMRDELAASGLELDIPDPQM